MPRAIPSIRVPAGPAGRASACLLACLLAATRAGAQPRLSGQVRVGVEQVELDRHRLGFDRRGQLDQVPVSESGLQQRLEGGITAIDERDLPGGWILDTETRLDFDVFSETQVTSERYDRASGRVRTTLARPLPKDAYLSVEARAETYIEQFLPDLEGTIAGVDVNYEREIKGDAYLSARVGARKGELANDPGDSFDEVRFRLEYEHLPPERVRPEILPFHKDAKDHSPWEFLLGHALKLDKARDLIRFYGDASMMADMIADPPLPRAWQGGDVRPDIAIRESAVNFGLELKHRGLESGNSYRRAALWGGVHWSLTDFLGLTVRDTVAAQDWEDPDPTRVRSDRLQNHFSLDLAYVKEFVNLNFQAGLDSHFLRDFDGFDYNRAYSGVYGGYDRGQRAYYSGYIRAAREFNRDERPDFPDLTRFDSFAAAGYRFNDRERLRVSYLRERVNITGPQTEFDSAYLDETARVSFKRKLTDTLAGEAGYQVKDETHEFFTENNRRERSVFLNVEASF